MTKIIVGHVFIHNDLITDKSVNFILKSFCSNINVCTGTIKAYTRHSRLSCH